MHFRRLHQQFDLRNDAEKMRASDSSRLSNIQNIVFESTCKRAGLTESNVRRMSVILISQISEIILLEKALTIRDSMSTCKRERDV